MMWFYENGNEIFHFFTFPLIGLVLDFVVPKKTRNYILISSIILFSPVFSGYSYIFPWLYLLFGLIIFSCSYSYFSHQIEKPKQKIITSLSISGILFLILSWFSFMDSFSGSTTTLRTWEFDDYKVEYIKSQGFSGGPLLTYELSIYGAIPIFIKKIETVRDWDTSNTCVFNFKKNNLVFDKCQGELTKTQ